MCIPQSVFDSLISSNGGSQHPAVPHRRVKSSSNLRDMYQQPLRMHSAKSDSGHQAKPAGCSNAAHVHRNNSGIVESDGETTLQNSKPKYADTGATAVNLKTGSSVFTLDQQQLLPPQQQTGKALTNKSSQKISSSSKKSKTPKKSQLARDRKWRRCRSEPEFTEALCITPIPTQRDLCDCTPSSSSADEGDDDEMVYDPRLHVQYARDTNSAFAFEKLAYPDLHNAKGSEVPESFFHRKFGVQR